VDILGIGFIGAGFSARFHLRGLVGVRGAEVVAVYSRTEKGAKEFSALSEELGLGRPRVYRDLHEMLADPRVNAVWITTPNDLRVEHVKAVTEEARQGKGNIVGVAIEKPLARNYKEAKEVVDMVERAGLLHGYLENQVFMPSFTKGREVVWSYGAKYSGRPYLARAAEEHSGPHSPWFWRPSISGGGVLLDMACHSIEASRVMLSDPSKPKGSLRPKKVLGKIVFLKWAKERYAEEIKRRFNVDFKKEPAEDYAIVIISYEDENGELVIGEARTSWAFVGAGLRLTFEVLGPEYSLYVTTHQPELFAFMSRNVKIPPSEAFIEKQNSDQGLMPVIPDEAVTYGYQAEDRHMVESFLRKRMPWENLRDGLLVVELMMLAYLSAEKGQEINYERTLIEDYIPRIAKHSSTG
jgi:predicted dehydrogenase